MADLSKLMKKRLGAPPALEDASDNLQAPEVAPSAPAKPTAVAAANVAKAERLDGRSLRATGRTVQFATRISPQLDHEIRQIAKSERLLITEVLEKAIFSLKRDLSAK